MFDKYGYRDSLQNYDSFSTQFRDAQTSLLLLIKV